MGSSASKATRAAAGNAARKYPSRPSPSTHTAPSPSAQSPASQPSQPGPTVHPKAQASGTRDEAINLDATDPVYAAHLRQLGAVQPNPILSHSSAHPADPRSPSAPTSHSILSPQTHEPSSSFPYPYPSALSPTTNPALRILQARQMLQEKADQEFENVGRRGFEGREFLDVGILREVLKLRSRGMPGPDIEKQLGLKSGVVARLGSPGVVDFV